MDHTDVQRALPNLPGYKTRMPPGDRRFPKNQTLHYKLGYKEEDAQQTLMCADEPREQPATISTIPTGCATAKIPAESKYHGKLPVWIENDRKTLRFFGYFQEHVTECAVENMRVRRVIFFFYLEDGTCHISEPRQDNSGLDQGTILKRHKAMRTVPETGDRAPLTPADFDIGTPLTLYGKTYMLVDADAFTRDWFAASSGRELGAPLEYPTNPSEEWLKSRRSRRTLGPPSVRTDDLARFSEAKLGKPSNALDVDRLRQFLENDGRVLRFWAVWDNRDELFGDRRPFIVHFYLADDTMEVLEVQQSNSGRDPFPVFIARAPIPRRHARRGFTVTQRVNKRDCYAPADLRIGEVIDLHARKMLLYACDSFTRTWYMENMGYTPEELQDMDIREEIPELPKPAMAPYNGFGSLKDSEQNCRSLVPQPPKKDLRKLVNKDGMILRFVAKFSPREDIGFEVQHADSDRQFILSYFMNDDTIAIFEPPVRNSGIIGGKFLERGVKYKPGTKEPFTYKDLYVGAEVAINKFNFALVHADEYTFSYMENNRHLFIMGDGAAVLKLLKMQVSGKEEALRSAFIEIDKDGSGHLDSNELAECLHVCGFRITRHQVIALTRLLDKDRSGYVDIKEFLDAISPTESN